MSYDCDWYGTLKVDNPEPKIIELNVIIGGLASPFEDISIHEIGEPNEVRFSGYGSATDEVEAFWDKVAEMGFEGNLICNGEDHLSWKLVFKDGKVRTIEGMMVYLENDRISNRISDLVDRLNKLQGGE